MQSRLASSRIWLVIAVVALVGLAAFSAWQFMDRRATAQTANERFAYAANEVSRGLAQAWVAPGEDGPDWRRRYEGVLIAEHSARMGTYGSSGLSGVPQEVSDMFHPLHWKLWSLYLTPAQRVANGDGSAEDRRRVEHLAATLERLEVIQPLNDGWDAYHAWLRRLLMATPAYNMSLARLAEHRIWEEGRITIDEDTFVIARYLGSRTSATEDLLFASVFHIPSWSVMSVDGDGNVLDEGIFSPEAEEIFAAVRNDEQKMERMAALAEAAPLSGRLHE